MKTMELLDRLSERLGGDDARVRCVGDCWGNDGQTTMTVGEVLAFIAGLGRSDEEWLTFDGSVVRGADGWSLVDTQGNAVLVPAGAGELV